MPACLQGPFDAVIFSAGLDSKTSARDQLLAAALRTKPGMLHRYPLPLSVSCCPAPVGALTSAWGADIWCAHRLAGSGIHLINCVMEGSAACLDWFGTSRAVTLQHMLSAVNSLRSYASSLLAWSFCKQAVVVCACSKQHCREIL